MADRLLPPGYQVFDGNGDPLSGAQLFAYSSGTSSPQDTYSDSDGLVANTNPVVADSAGRFGPVFGGASAYKLVLKTAAGVTIWTADPVTGGAGATAATQTEVDTRTTATKYVSPSTIAGGVGLQGASIASAATLTFPTVGDYFSVTGTTGITALSTRTAGRRVLLRFAGVLTLTHSTALNLGGSDITTAANDVMEFISEGAGTWRLVMPMGFRTITSGNGLTGGGDLSADRTLAVGAGTGIVANADDVAVDKATAANMRSGTSNKVPTADILKGMVIVAAAKFNGTTGALIGSAVNVTSVTRTSAGAYSVNLTNALADTNFLVLVCTNGGAAGRAIVGGSPATTSSITVNTADAVNTLTDFTQVSVIAVAP